MACKTVKKKKAFQAFCREQVKNGLINKEDGSWTKMDHSKAMHRDCVAGYKFR